MRTWFNTPRVQMWWTFLWSWYLWLVAVAMAIQHRPPFVALSVLWGFWWVKGYRLHKSRWRAEKVQRQKDLLT